MSSSALYKYVSISVLRKILQGSVRFTQPSAFNDPFELLPAVVVPNGESERQISISFDTRAKRRQPIGGEAEDVNQCVANDATSRDIVKHLNGVIGIFCLSRTHDSLLMWSHYADQYSGAVIEFDSSHEFFDGLIEVEYRSLRPRKHINAYSPSNQPVPIAELCVKSDQWKYEQEVRIVRCLADCEHLNDDPRGFPIFVGKIPNECIKSIILGERTKVSEQIEIYECVKNTRIALSLAAVDQENYAFRNERVKFNVPVSEVGPMMSPRTAHIFSQSQSQRGEFARWMIEKHPMSKIVNKPV